ncbi:MAG: hypothetical protein O7D91_18710 [Planctomycetota bacterium]|nr:hypothetical protein [Planctomycetota bacterium]
MAIQFNCPGCRQPVEVDDEWAGEHVTCPFCQRVVTAPAESTITTLQNNLPPTARRLSPSGPGGMIETGAAPPPRYNRMAVAGFGLGLAAIFLIVLGQIMLQFVVDEMGPNPTFEEQQKKTMELYSDPETRGRMLMGLGSFCLSSVCWLTGVIVSVIAVTRKDLPGRRLAIAGVTCSALIPLLFCVGLLFG